MKIYVDFDGTISPCHYPEELTEPPHAHCVEKMRQWKTQGYTIVIYSCRANRSVFPDQTDERWQFFYQQMLDYLKKHNVPYDEIDTTKPLFQLLIDDRAHHPREFWSCL